MPCNTVLVCAARSWCDDLFFVDGECRVHDRKRVNYLPSLTGAIMHPSRPSLLGFPGESWKGPEANPLTSHVSLFWLPPFADSQTRCPLEISQPCGLKKRPLVQQTSSGLQSLVQQTSSGPAATWSTDLSRSSRAHCVRWVARLYQKPSLSCHRWVMTGQDNWTSRGHHSPITDGPGTTGCQKPSLSCHTGQARSTGL